MKDNIKNIIFDMGNVLLGGGLLDEMIVLYAVDQIKKNDVAKYQLVRQMNFKARAEIGRIRNERMKEVKRRLADRGPIGIQFRNTLSARYPAMCFRNLDQLTDEQIAQIASDVEILEMLKQEDEQSK